MAIAKSPNSATKAPRKPAAKRTAKPAAAKSTTPKAAASKAAAPKPATAKPAAATKSAAPKAAAKAPARKPTASKPAPRKRAGLISAIALGFIAAGSAVALFGRRLLQPGNAEHQAPDLALDQPRPGTADRAPAMFRPDPTAEVPESEREALRPATLPNGSLATH